MPLSRGAKRMFEWLRDKPAGYIASLEEILDATGWKHKSWTTYIGKNKLAPFVAPLSSGSVKVLMPGDQISEQFFFETFTQTAPKPVALFSGDRLHGQNSDYELVEPLGHGAVGHVWSARRAGPDVSMVAVKVMMPTGDLLSESKLPNVRERFRREALNGSSLDHQNIVKYLDHGDAEKNPFLVMELANQSVGKYLRTNGPLDSEEIEQILEDCISALRYLHERDCPHRDIKPDNMLQFDEAYKLGDLGIVGWKDFDEAVTHGGTITRASVQLGSWFYMAPEQQRDPHEATTMSDVYALAISWIELLSGIVPAPQGVGSHAYEFPTENDIHRDLVARMLAYEPSSRPSLDEIEAIIKT